MKKAACVVLALTMLLSIVSVAMSESLYVDNRETDKVYPERLNLRSEPSKNGAILGLYYTGAQVQNLGAENDEYVKVSIGGMTGFMASEYLITQEEALARYGNESGFGNCRAAEIDLGGMWQTEAKLFTESDAASAVLCTLENKKPVDLIGVLGEWAYIRVKEKEGELLGYVQLDLLTDVRELKVCIVAGSRADTQTILYDAPNGKAAEIMRLKNGTACLNLFGRKEGEWRRVRVGGVSGWIKYTQTDNLVALGDQPRNVVPYYPLLMKTKAEATLYSEYGDENHPTMKLGKGVQVEVLAERGELAYVRTLEGGLGTYDAGNYGYMRLSDLSLSQAEGSVGVAQMDNDDVPVIVLKTPDADAEMVGALCGGAQVRIVEYTQTDYVHVSLGGVSGYIPKNEIRILSGENPQVSDRIPQRATALDEMVLRDKPSASAKKIETAQTGNRVYMLGRFGDWAFVRHAGDANLDVNGVLEDHTGFVPLNELNAPASTTHLMAFANTDKVNLRSTASSTKGQIIGRVRTGQRLRVADYGNEWTAVVMPDGTRGYIMTKYLDFE